MAHAVNPHDEARIDDGYADHYVGRFEQGEHVPDETQSADAEGVDWGDVPAGATAGEAPAGAYTAPVTYPEVSDNPHNHRFTISMVPDKAPMIVVRGNTAAEITAALNELEAMGVYANLGAAAASMRTQGVMGAGLGPMSPPPPPAAPGGPPMPPPQGNTPPPFGPNVSVPSAPGYQGPPQGQQWPAQPQSGGGWNGQNQGRAQAKPRPGGWLAAEIPFSDKDRFRTLRAQNTDTGNYLRGKIQWGGGGTYWIDPSVAAWLAQQGFPVTQ